MEENGKLVQFIFNENKEVITEETDGNITRLIRTSDLWARESEPEKTWCHYASDEQGSTVFITGKNGEVKNRYTYDAFGNTIEAKEKIPNRYQYTGQQLDPITQQYYLRARYYNPAIARFTQEDEYHGDGLNLYAYCANNPVGYYDPSGYSLISSEAFSKLVVKANHEGIGGLSDNEVSDMAEYWRKNNPNPYKLSQEQAENVMRQGYKYPMEERVGTGLKVPEPESYLPKEYIENHANAFEGGASHLEKGYSYHQFYENAPYFQRSADHHIFVTPKKDMDLSLLEAGKGHGGRIDTSIMEKRLGYNCGALTGDDLFVINIGDVNKHQVRIPLGTEMGCNEHWICGGYTEGMMPEGIAYNVKNRSEF
ncbi:RHS repeat-associated core domain-containing protein [Selenomonas caprae]|uniref:RHS repeat-associated core domain-containing protein n=2 Tax=Selenomonas caprae TaxID=2606905 RepID=A0A5D6WR38_9FIRM|nr:RHS repeat-associated core domain-containing protein [Selenomonas caprae]